MGHCYVGYAPAVESGRRAQRGSSRFVRVSGAAALLVLASCAAPAPARPTSPLRAYYVPAEAPECASDESELGASIASLHFDDQDARGAVLTPAATVLVRAADDCRLTTRTRVLRLTSSESYAQSCRPSEGDSCAFVRSCWVLGGPPGRACDESEQARIADLVAMLGGQSVHAAPGLVEIDPAGRTDAPTVYVETGNFYGGQGHLVQRVDGAWRVVLFYALMWQA